MLRVNHEDQQLTLRQQQIVSKLLMGKANKVIAAELEITEGTVKAHMHVIYKILRVKNHVEAVIALSNYRHISSATQ